MRQAGCKPGHILKSGRIPAGRDIPMSDYNGYTNYETWAVSLWISNDQALQAAFNERAEDNLRRARMYPVDYLSISADARIGLADEVKAWAEDAAPDLGASLWADLLGAALGEVDWADIADNMLSDTTGYERAE